MAGNSDKMPLLEKVKALQELEQRRKREFDELEEKNKKEGENLRSELANTLSEISAEEEQKFKESEEKRKAQESRNESTASLEETLEKENLPSQNTESQGNLYISGNITNTNVTTNLYDVTNYNVYNKVKDLVRKAEDNMITPEEQNFLSSVAYHVDKMRREELYSAKDSAGYLGRTDTLLKQIDKNLKGPNY